MQQTRIAVGQLVIAICAVVIAAISLTVAIVSLRATATQQSADLEHQELLITPNLFARVDDAALGLALVNSGLGPARIKRISVQVGDHCYNSSHMKPGAWDEKATEIRSEIVSAIYSNLMADIRERNDTSAGDANLVSIGELIPQQGGVLLLTLRGDAQASRPTDLNSIQGVRARFRENMKQLKLEIAYCSMTGLSCFVLSEGKPNCVTDAGLPKQGPGD